jgi:hypothetical protein
MSRLPWNPASEECSQIPQQLHRVGRLAKAIHLLQNYEVTVG